MDRIVDLSDRFKLRFTGPQALWFLDQLVTNQILDMPPGTAKQALLLTPKGRITADLNILATENGALATVDAEDPQAVLDFFTMRIFATKVTIENVTDHFALLRYLTEGSSEFPVKVEAPDLPADANEVEIAPLDPPLEGSDVWVPCSGKDYIFRTMADAGVQEVSGDEYEAYRVSVGVPRFGVDFDASYLPQEAALERAVHFKKGCYLGQEAVAMTQRGRVRRRVRRLEFAGQGAPGDLWLEDKKVGSVTSVAGSAGIGTVAASVAPGATVEVGSDSDRTASAVVQILPGTVEGPSVPSARELRERLRGG